eukprot:TRINITY_DN2954_c0_g1_i8.p1 TRINITY_DN2954_c0_g1~~TRINITY_DN2954_c0_g1_i8.p1  ORF type:complete len:500 (-),score=127.29 TRINITY_DN2954_c0_g1_i8:218-1717(-)
MQARLEQVAERLEQVASRLETASQGGDGGSVVGGAPVPKKAANVSSSQQLGSTTASTGGGGNSVQAFQALLKDKVYKVVEVAEKLPKEVKKITGVLSKAFEEELRVVDTFTQCKQPDSMYLRKLVQPVSEQMKAAAQIADGPRSDFTNHFRAVSESMQAMAWVVYTGPSSGMDPPGQMVAGILSVSEVYINRIIMAFRGKSEDHVAWARGLKTIFTELKVFVEQYYPNGPVWNKTGKDVPGFLSKGGSSMSVSSSAPTPASSGGTQTAAAPTGKGMSSIFGEISKAQSGTSSLGLKKVTDDMKTKNRTDRSGLVEAKQPTPAAAAKFGGAALKPTAPKQEPPKKELQGGRKWVVENFKDDKEIILDETSKEQSVYIYNCVGCVIQVKGKVNAISLDKCKKTGMVFENAVSVVEVVHASSIQVQCTGVVPTINIDNTDGCTVFLNEQSLETTVTTSKSSEVNISIPTDDGDFSEHPIPEQFVSSYVDGKFVTEPVSHSAG